MALGLTVKAVTLFNGTVMLVVANAVCRSLEWHFAKCCGNFLIAQPNLIYHSGKKNRKLASNDHF